MTISDVSSASPSRMNDTKDILSLLRTRRSDSISRMTSDGPTEEEVRAILAAGARVPDHGKLAPWRFIVFRNTGREKFGQVLEKRLHELNPQAGEQQLAFEREKFMRAPLIIGLVSRAAPHVKIPEWEQELSAGASGMNILIAATALGFAAQWVTEWNAYDRDIARHLGLEDHERMAGFIFIGGMSEQPTDRDRPDLATIVTEYGSSANR